MNKSQMGKIKDTYVYVKHFQHHSKKYKEAFNNHPKNGNIYRATYVDNGEKKGWRIAIDDVSVDGLEGIFMKNLIDYTDLWSHELYEATQDVIENEDISDEELKKIVEWESSDEDVTEEFNIIGSDQLENKEEEMESHEDEVKNIFQGVVDWLDLMLQEDQPMFDAVTAFITHVGNTYLDKYRSSALSTRGMLANGEQGKGANMHNAAKYIARYINTGSNKSDNPIDLLKSAHYLMFELARVSEEANRVREQVLDAMKAEREAEEAKQKKVIRKKRKDDESPEDNQ